MKHKQTYAKLRLLAERKNYPKEFKQLFEHLDDPELDQIFFIADKESWRRLKSAENSHKLTIVDPTDDGPEPLEVFRPLKFYITTGDDPLDNSYLFNRGLRFQWTFELLDHGKKNWIFKVLDYGKKRILGDDPKTEPKPLTPETRSPRVAQYA